MKRSTRLALFLAATFLAVAAVAWSSPAHAKPGPSLRTLPLIAKVCAPDENPCIGSIKLSSDIDADSVTQLAFYLQLAEYAEADAVLVGIDSAGGGLGAGRALRKLILESKVPVYCLADHMTASVAFWAFQACKDRMILPGTTLMTHRPYAAFPPGTTMQIDELLAAAELLTKANREIAASSAPRLGMTVDAYLAKVASEDWFLAGGPGAVPVEAALAAHGVDAVVDSPLAAVARILTKLTASPRAHR